MRAWFASLLIASVVLASCDVVSPSQSRLGYDDKAVECPAPSETDRYIEVPFFYDLAAFGAKIDNVPGINNHNDLRTDDTYGRRKFKVYYELAKPFDSAKELFVLINGGPGGDHQILHTFDKVFPWVYENYNVVSMDHRFLGCSDPTMPGGSGSDKPYQAMLMRYAASDIESIRRELAGPEGKINVWGGSYGSMLGQTYALLYPDHVNKLVLAGAFSKSADFNEAQRIFESLVTSSSPEFSRDFAAFKATNPADAKHFLSWAVRPMYNYFGRVQKIPAKFAEFKPLIEQGKLEEAHAITQPDKFVMGPMMRAIACVEIFNMQALHDDEFQMFPVNFETCKEFGSNFEYFDYTAQLSKLPMRTLLLSGAYDHVTTLDSMLRMTAAIPNNYMHLDRQLGHDVIWAKPDCQDALMKAFFTDANNEALHAVSTSGPCRAAPKAAAE